MALLLTNSIEKKKKNGLKKQPIKNKHCHRGGIHDDSLQEAQQLYATITEVNNFTNIEVVVVNIQPCFKLKMCQRTLIKTG